MKKSIRNEAGYTLILVLLIITLFFIFSLTLMGNLLNSSSQNNKTEEDIQEENLVRMGSTYVEKLFSETDQKVKSHKDFRIGENDIETTESYQTIFIKELPIGSKNTIAVENEKFLYEITHYGDVKDNKFTITYTVTPFLNNVYHHSRTLKKEITIIFE